MRQMAGPRETRAPLWLLAVALAFSTLPSPSYAQTLLPDSPIEAVVSAQGHAAYSFRGTAGEIVYVVVRADSPDVALDLSFEPTNDSALAISSRFPGGLKNVYGLEETGVHRVTVLNASARDIHFELEVLHPASQKARTIAYGECHDGHIDQPDELRVYAFQGRSNDVFFVSLERLGDTTRAAPRVLFHSLDDQRQIVAPAPAQLKVPLNREGAYRLTVDEMRGVATDYRLCLAQTLVRVSLPGDRGKEVESTQTSYSKTSPKDFEFEVSSGQLWRLDIQNPAVETFLALRSPQGETAQIQLEPGSTGTTFDSLGPGIYRLSLESPTDESAEISLVWSRVETPPAEPSRWRFILLMLAGGLLGALLAAASRPLRNQLVFPTRDTLKCLTVGFGASLLVAVAGEAGLFLVGLGETLHFFGQVGPFMLGLLVGVAAPVLWLKFSLK